MQNEPNFDSVRKMRAKTQKMVLALKEICENEIEFLYFK